MFKTHFQNRYRKFSKLTISAILIMKIIIIIILYNSKQAHHIGSFFNNKIPLLMTILLRDLGVGFGNNRADFTQNHNSIQSFLTY